MGLTCRESRIAAKYSSQLKKLVIVHSCLESDSDVEEIEEIIQLIWIRRRAILRERVLPRAPYIHLNRAVVSFFTGQGFHLSDIDPFSRTQWP